MGRRGQQGALAPVAPTEWHEAHWTSKAAAEHRPHQCFFLEIHADLICQTCQSAIWLATNRGSLDTAPGSEPNPSFPIVRALSLPVVEMNDTFCQVDWNSIQRNSAPCQVYL